MKNQKEPIPRSSEESGRTYTKKKWRTRKNLYQEAVKNQEEPKPRRNEEPVPKEMKNQEEPNQEEMKS